MARNVRRVVALIGTLAFAAVGGENLSISKAHYQAELDQNVNGKTLFEKETLAATVAPARPATASARAL